MNRKVIIKEGKKSIFDSKLFLDCEVNSMISSEYQTHYDSISKISDINHNRVGNNINQGSKSCKVTGNIIPCDSTARAINSCKMIPDVNMLRDFDTLYRLKYNLAKPTMNDNLNTHYKLIEQSSMGESIRYPGKSALKESFHTLSPQSGYDYPSSLKNQKSNLYENRQFDGNLFPSANVNASNNYFNDYNKSTYYLARNFVTSNQSKFCLLRSLCQCGLL